MEIREAYNIWADQYDTNINKTRDLEAISLRESISRIAFENCLEIGCGTGKNTEWLITQSKLVTSVDFSEEMLSRAKSKIISPCVEFVQADIARDWTFRNRLYDLVIFSLILEHIENLDHIFFETSRALVKNGNAYIGELHPYKQYAGTKARFEGKHGLEVLQCFVHNISDFVRAAEKYDLELVDLDEYFDDDNRKEIPRILKLIFKKK